MTSRLVRRRRALAARTPLRRSGWLRARALLRRGSGAGLKRSGRLKARRTVGRKGRERFPKLVDRKLRAFVRSLPCLVARTGPCVGRVEAAHVRSKATGRGDRDQLVPLCAGHHRLAPLSLHNVGTQTFERERGVNLAAEARKITAEYAMLSRSRAAQETP